VMLNGHKIQTVDATSNGRSGQKTYHVAPLRNKEGKSKFFTVETDPQTGLFKTAYFDQHPENLLRRLMNLRSDLRHYILAEVRRNGSTGILIKPQPEENTLYYENTNGLYELRWKELDGSFNFETFQVPEGVSDPKKAKEGLIDLSFILDLKENGSVDTTVSQNIRLPFLPRLEFTFEPSLRGRTTSSAINHSL